MASLDFEVPVVDGPIPADIEYLYWVGCTGALDERARKTVESTARVLHRAGVNFGVLGPRETCSGDPARRMGNEYLFQELAKANIATLNEVGAKKIVASCAHCFNTIKNEYPDLGGNYEVVHHSELLSHLVANGRLVPGDSYSGHRNLARPVLSGAPQSGLRRAAFGVRRGPRRHAASRWPATARRASAAGRVGRACGWRRTSASASTLSGPRRLWRRARTWWAPPVRSA